MQRLRHLQTIKRKGAMMQKLRHLKTIKRKGAKMQRRKEKKEKLILFILPLAIMPILLFCFYLFASLHLCAFAFNCFQMP